MAKLILTEEERRSPTFLEWDDVSLGRAAKAIASICDDDHGKHALKATGAAVFLVSEAIRSGATELTVNLEGATDGKRDLGNWKITIEAV